MTGLLQGRCPLPVEVLLCDGTELYDLWYNGKGCCFVFDTDAYEGKALGVTVLDGVVTFGYTK